MIDSAKELDSLMVDYWHIDSREDIRVFEDIDRLGSISNTPADVHIISENPALFIPELNRPNIARVSFQIEEIIGEFHLPKLIGKEVGIAIHINHTHIEKTIERYIEDVDFVLLMMTTPGVSGGRFESEYFSKIQSLIRAFPNTQWCVDGGVNHEISYILRLIGVQSVVVGSYLMNHQNMAQAILQIRSNYVRSEFKVGDFCIATTQLPIVDSNTNVIQLLETMQSYKLGMAFYNDPDGRFVGIISNADIRKVLISGHFSYDMNIECFVNKNPKYIEKTYTTAEMIEYIQSIPFPILVLPIVNTQGMLYGAISFHKLLKED